MTLRKAILKLALEVPETRAHLVPLLKQAAWGQRRFSPNRDFYLPDHAKGMTPLTPEGTELAVYSYEDENGRPYAIAFNGKASKPVWYHRFTSEAQRQAYINKTIESFRKVQAAKTQRRQERTEFIHDIKVGDILYSSWGYDQTNISWYQVTKVIGKAVEIRELAYQVTGTYGSNDTVVPVPNRFSGPPMRKLPQRGYQGKVIIRINSYANAYPWDGDPVHQTNPMYGH